MAGKMEVDGSGGGVMASTSCPGSVSVSLHPLVIMNISEHWTRVRAQEGKPTQGTCRSSQYDSYCVEAGKYIRPWLKVISNLCYVSYFKSVYTFIFTAMFFSRYEPLDQITRF